MDPATTTQQIVHWYTDPQWYVAIGTPTALLLGIAGIYREWFVSILFKPKFKVQVMRQNSPDCSTEVLVNRMNQNSKISDVHMFRLCIENIGTAAASNVEAVITDISREEANGKMNKLPIPPFNLGWTYILNNWTLPKIYSGSPRYLDIGFLLPTKLPKSTPLQLDTSYKCAFKIATSVEPASNAHILYPGKYEFRIQLIGENFSRQEYSFRLQFDNDWNSDIDKMTVSHISLDLI